MPTAEVMSDVDRKLLKETRKRTTYYRSEKENNIFDTFFHSHLDFMEKCMTFYEESSKSGEFLNR